MTEMTMTDLIELQDLGLCLLAVVTHDHVARALALGVLGLDLQQARELVARSCWGDRMEGLREAVAEHYPPAV